MLFYIKTSYYIICTFCLLKSYVLLLLHLIHHLCPSHKNTQSYLRLCRITVPNSFRFNACANTPVQVLFFSLFDCIGFVCLLCNFNNWFPSVIKYYKSLYTSLPYGWIWSGGCSILLGLKKYLKQYFFQHMLRHTFPNSFGPRIFFPYSQTNKMKQTL